MLRVTELLSGNLDNFTARIGAEFTGHYRSIPVYISQPL